MKNMLGALKIVNYLAIGGLVLVGLLISVSAYRSWKIERSWANYAKAKEIVEQSVGAKFENRYLEQDDPSKPVWTMSMKKKAVVLLEVGPKGAFGSAGLVSGDIFIDLNVSKLMEKAICDAGHTSTFSIRRSGFLDMKKEIVLPKIVIPFALDLAFPFGCDCC